MKRIIKMDNQVTEGEKMFAIWDTVRDKFDEIGSEQSWESADELADAFDYEIHKYTRVGVNTDARVIRDLAALKNRCVGLARGSGY